LSVNYSPEFDDSGPNTSLLRRLAELGGGKVLNPDSENPFTHDRKETFQPLDLRDWLLKLAILLFPLDVGVRRIQIDRAEWLRATKKLRRWLMPWRGVPRTKEADESLSALLNRRGRVRSERTAVAPSATLFEPEKKVPVAEPGKAAPLPRGEGVPSAGTSDKPPAKDQPSVTSRLLDAKRRAQKRKDRE
jgi:hypothetical protein